MNTKKELMGKTENGNTKFYRKLLRGIKMRIEQEEIKYISITNVSVYIYLKNGFNFKVTRA